MSKSARMKSSLTNRTSVFGIMGGLSNNRISRMASMHRATSRLVIPTSAKLGMQFMKKYNLLSKNPQGSGGVGRIRNTITCCGSGHSYNEKVKKLIEYTSLCPVEYPNIAGDETQGFYCCKKKWDDGKCLDISSAPEASDAPNMCILQSGNPSPSICDSSYCLCEEVSPSLAKKYPVMCLYANVIADTVIRTNCGCGCIWGNCLFNGNSPPPMKNTCCSSTCADEITYDKLLDDFNNGMQTCSLGTDSKQFSIFYDLITKDTITNTDSITYNELLMRSWVGEEFSKIPIYGFFYTDQEGGILQNQTVISFAIEYKRFTNIALPIVLLSLDDLLDNESNNPFTDISYSDDIGNIQNLQLANTLNNHYNNNSKKYSTTNGVLVHVVTGNTNNMRNSNNRCDISNQAEYHLPWCPYDDQIKKGFSCSLLKKGLIPKNGLPDGEKMQYPVFDTTNGRNVVGLIMKPD